MRIAAEIETLLAESPAAAAQRERDTFPRQLQGTDGSVVLFGAGRLGRLCARALRRLGVPLRAWCDRNPRLQGAELDGAEVLAPDEAGRRFGGSSLFVVAIWTGTAGESMVERVDWLRSLGCRHVVPYPALAWAGGGDEIPFHSFARPAAILQHGGEVRRLARLLADDASRRVLLAALRQRLRGEFADEEPAPDQYFPRDLVRLRANEVVVDGGAYDGDTLEALRHATGGGFHAYHAFEPDPANADRLRQRIAALPEEVRGRVTVHPVALHNAEAELEFASHGAPTSGVAVAGGGRVPGRRLDALLPDVPVTVLKLDVEGAERAVLAGARSLLTRQRPLTMVCVYHGPADLWELPLQLHAWMPESRLYLRQHGRDGWETVCYLVPPDRLAPRRPCPVCLDTSPRDVVHRQSFAAGALGEGYDVVVCPQCGAGFADGIPTQDELDRYYAAQSKYLYAHAGGIESTWDFKRFEVIARQLEPHLPAKTARILDIGCATGGLLSVLKARGFVQLTGSDPSPACCEIAHRLYGVETRAASLAEHATWTDRFDAILLVGVLEHVRDVRAAVRVAARLLRPGGVLYCAQPDVEAFADCDNAPYQQFSTEHLNFFSSASLARLLAAEGLAARQTWRWMIEWREGITDSVVSGVFVRGAAPLERDEVTAPALRQYLRASRAQDGDALDLIAALVRTQEPLLVWGAGTLTRRLLATTDLARANIAAFVDANPALAGSRLAGRPILTPGQLAGRGEAILIGSRAFEAEIRRLIAEQLRLPNRVKSLFPRAGGG